MSPRTDYAERAKAVEAYIVKEGLFHRPGTEVVNTVWAWQDKEGKTRLADFKIREIRHRVRHNAGLHRDGLPTYPKHRKLTAQHRKTLAWAKDYLDKSGKLVFSMMIEDLVDAAKRHNIVLGRALASKLLKNARKRNGLVALKAAKPVAKAAPHVNGVTKPVKGADIEEDVAVLAHAMERFGYTSIGIFLASGKVTWTGDRKKVEVISVKGEIKVP